MKRTTQASLNYRENMSLESFSLMVTYFLFKPCRSARSFSLIFRPILKVAVADHNIEWST